MNTVQQKHIEAVDKIKSNLLEFLEKDYGEFKVKDAIPQIEKTYRILQNKIEIGVLPKK
jgi:hypothetical protein